MKEKDAILEVYRALERGEDIEIDRGESIEAVKKEVEKLKKLLRQREEFLKREVNEELAEMLQREKIALVVEYTDVHRETGNIWIIDLTEEGDVIETEDTAIAPAEIVIGHTRYKFVEKYGERRYYMPYHDKTKLQLIRKDKSEREIPVIAQNGIVRSAEMEEELFMRCRNIEDIQTAKLLYNNIEYAIARIQRIANRVYLLAFRGEANIVVAGHKIQVREEYNGNITKRYLIVDGKRYRINEEMYKELERAAEIYGKEELRKALKEAIKKILLSKNVIKKDEEEEKKVETWEKVTVKIAKVTERHAVISEAEVKYVNYGKRQVLYLNGVEVFSAKNRVYSAFKMLVNTVPTSTVRATEQRTFIDAIIRSLRMYFDNIDEEEVLNRIMIALM